MLVAGSDSHNTHSSEGDSTRQRVYTLLDKNPLLTPKQLCLLLRLPYKENHDYLAHIRSAWKYDPKRQQGSICSIHGWRGWTQIPDGAVVDRGALETSFKTPGGWIQTRARNRWLLFKDPQGLGRLQWFTTDRVNIYVRRPATMGKAVQLLARAFSWTSVISDLNVLKVMFRGIRFKGAHYVFELGVRLPGPVTIDLFGPSNGIIVKLGDRSHPSSVEILTHYPDWAERNEKLFHDLLENLKLFSQAFEQDPAGPQLPKNSYWV